LESTPRANRGSIGPMIAQLKEIAVSAGNKILEYYGDRRTVEVKSDQSPLTQADLSSHKLICEALGDLDHDIPVLSEESSEEEVDQRLSWERLWVVDPLDGTKEFIKQSGQFTVNIALVEGGETVLGVVYAPAIKAMYWAERGAGAFCSGDNGVAVAIRTRTPDRSKLSIVASRDHAGPQVAALLARFPEAETRSMGSSLKFCLVAEGKADVYLRDVPTREWDTAAAQCVVEAAGGGIWDLNGQRLMYNKVDLTNPSLITLGDRNFQWQ
jgi:3'(2'), 5'-bisphosphate nucleotidase